METNTNMKLIDILNYSINPGSVVNRKLPNGGGSYTAPVVAPKPGGYGSVDYVDPKIGIRSLYGDNGKGADYAYPQPEKKVEAPASKGTGTVFNSSKSQAVEAPVVPTAQAELDYSKYINPSTGKPYTPQEYADNLASRMGNGTIPNYAGDAIVDPNKSQAELELDARNLNNDRNDIATGAKDPYKIGAESGIQYTPNELAAVEDAYKGIFNPALNDVFTRLKARQEEDKKAEDARIKAEERKQDLADWTAKQIFTTDQNIRQWKQTTGTRSGGEGEDPERFTKTQLNKGSTNLGIPLSDFNKLDGELKNFFINLPTEKDPDSGKSYTQKMLIENILSQVTSGDYSPDEASAEIESMNVSPEVKHYYIQQMPLPPEEKESWFSKIWNSITI